MKLSKSDFFKQELEFLSHKLGPHGISPADDKKSAIDRIKPPTNVREVRSVIGLLGYLNFYIPAYSELIRHMMKLTHKNVPFHWDDKCCRALELAKLHLQQSPVMIYPNKSKVFHLFTDASNYTWSSALMQVIDERNPAPPPEKREQKVLSFSLPTKKQPPYVFFEGKPLHPIVFHSGSFAGSAVNWSAFTKEAAVIFKAILRMTFYLMDSDVIVHTDCKLLKKFIEAVTANSRVNDWSFQIHAICKSIMFQHIKGSANVLVDSLST